MMPEVTGSAEADEEGEQESSGLKIIARISAASGVGGLVVSSNTGGILQKTT